MSRSGIEKSTLKLHVSLAPAGGLGRVLAWGRLGVSAQMAMTKDPGLGGVNSTCLFLTVPEAAKSKIKVADLGSSESASPGLEMASFLLCCPMLERHGSGVPSSSYAATHPIVGHPHDSSKPSCLLKALPQNAILLWGGALTCEFEGGHIQPETLGFLSTLPMSS